MKYSGEQLILRFAWAPTEQNLCIADTSFANEIKSVIEGAEINLRERILQYPNLGAALTTIAASYGMQDIFDEKVVGTYIFGTSDFNASKIENLQIFFQEKEKRLHGEVPRNELFELNPFFLPHHLFLLMYEGIAKDEGKLFANMKEINNCAVRYGEVEEIGEKVKVKTHKYKIENREIKTENIEEDFELEKILQMNLRPGMKIAIHRGVIFVEMDDNDVENLINAEKYIIEKMNEILAKFFEKNVPSDSGKNN